MDLELTDDQGLFRETTAKFIEATCPIDTVREWSESEPHGFNRKWWSQGAELGWTSLLVSEEHGGGSVSGHGLLDLILVAEEQGRRVTPGPLLPVNVVAAALSEFGTSEQADRHLPGLLSGESIATWCIEAGRGSILPGGPRLQATKDGAGYRISGVTAPIEAADVADLFLAVADVDGVPIHVLVDAATPGVVVSEMESIDFVRRHGAVHFNDVSIGAGSLLGGVADASEQIDRLLDLAVVIQCASMSGAIDQVLGFTLEYAFDRYSFGRPLASYQALKHRFADHKIFAEASLATTVAAANAVDARAGDASELASTAKAYIAQSVTSELHDFVQLTGGIGTTWDHDLHLFIRRAVQERALLGSPADHRERIALILGLGAA